MNLQAKNFDLCLFSLAFSSCSVFFLLHARTTPSWLGCRKVSGCPGTEQHCPFCRRRVNLFLPHTIVGNSRQVEWGGCKGFGACLHVLQGTYALEWPTCCHSSLTGPLQPVDVCRFVSFCKKLQHFVESASRMLARKSACNPSASFLDRTLCANSKREADTKTHV